MVRIVNEHGVLNLESLRHVADITDKILAMPGVITRDVLGLRTVDDVTVNGDQLGVRPLLADEPTNAVEVAVLRKAPFENPLLVGRFISADATTTAIYVPIEPTANGKEIADQIRRVVADSHGPERFYVAGDPVARDTFGAQMFRQMGVFSPVAGMVMCVMLWLMFRSGALVAANMGVAMLSVVWAMGALIACGYPVHIMSSMIPVFLMAISTDTVHIFNEFYFRFGERRDKRGAVLETMRVVGPPVVLSDLTTAAAFASLATGPIVPVKVFGIFVAVGTLGILLMSFTVVPAVLMLMSERRVQAMAERQPAGQGGASAWLAALGRWGAARSRVVLVAGLALLALAAFGMSQIRVNNNMVSWFRARSEIRQADRVLNEKLGCRRHAPRDDAGRVVCADTSAAGPAGDCWSAGRRAGQAGGNRLLQPGLESRRALGNVDRIHLVASAGAGVAGDRIPLVALGRGEFRATAVHRGADLRSGRSDRQRFRHADFGAQHIVVGHGD